MSSLYKQSLSAKYGGAFQGPGMLLCLSWLWVLEGRGLMSGTEQYRNQRVRVLSVMGSPDEAILGAPCSVVINHRYPQAARGPKLNL